MKVEEYLRRNNKSIKNNINNFIKRSLITIIIVLLVLIICNKNNNFKDKVKSVLNSTFNFSKINEIYNKYLFKIKDKKEKVLDLVSSNKIYDYTSIEENKDGSVYLEVGEDYPVKVLDNSLIVYIGNKNDMEVVIVEEASGIDVIYGNVNVSDYKVYDYVSRGSIIGKTNSDKLYLSFSRDNEVIDYRPYIEN